MGKAGPVGTVIKHATTAIVAGAIGTFSYLMYLGGLPDKKQQEANDIAAGQTKAVDKAEGQDRRENADARKRAKADAKPDDKIADRTVPLTADQKTVVAAREAGVRAQNKPGAEKAKEKIMGRDSEGCELTAISTDGSKYDQLRVSCKRSTLADGALGVDKDKKEVRGVIGTRNLTTGAVEAVPGVPKGMQSATIPITALKADTDTLVVALPKGGLTEFNIDRGVREALAKPPTP